MSYSKNVTIWCDGVIMNQDCINHFTGTSAVKASRFLAKKKGWVTFKQNKILDFCPKCAKYAQNNIFLRNYQK